MNNYEDNKCVWGYMTICDSCKPLTPKHVNIKKEVAGFPIVQCEICKKRNKDESTY